eukprot:5268092-Alexandrium_andersonii.AAC.1
MWGSKLSTVLQLIESGQAEGIGVLQFHLGDETPTTLRLREAMHGISEGSALVGPRPPQSAGSDAHDPGGLESQQSQLVPASPAA